MLAWILERWRSWSDNGGDIETVFSKDDLLTHAMIFWVNNAIGTSIRTYANNNRYPWTPSHDRRPVIEAPTGITFVGTRTHRASAPTHGCSTSSTATAPIGTTTSTSPRTTSGGHFIPWEVPTEWTTDLRNTFRAYRPGGAVDVLLLP